MARPVKTGLDYFPIDIDIDQDDRIYMLEAQLGEIAFGRIVKLWAEIYREGYYKQWGEQEALIFAGKKRIPIEEVHALIDAAVACGLLDKNLYGKYKILTSEAIQKRYFLSVSRRQTINVNNNYLLVDINVYINPHSVVINVDSGTQSKAKQRKEKHSRGCGHVDNSTPEAVLERIHRNNTYHLDFSGSECEQFSDILRQHELPLEFIDFIFHKMRNASTEIRAPARYFTSMLTKPDKLHDVVQDWQREKPIDPLPRAGPPDLETCPECGHTEFRKDGNEIMCMQCRNIWHFKDGEWKREP